MDLTSANEIAASLKKANLRAQVEETKRGHVIRFSGGRYGRHSLDVSASTPERVRIHWKGYCESSLEPPEGGMGRHAAQELCKALGPRRKHLMLAGDAGSRVVKLSVVDPARGQAACIELYRTQPAGDDDVLAQVCYYGRKPSEVASEIEDAFGAAGCTSIKLGAYFNYTASTSYRVKVVRLTPHRAFIRGRYRHGGLLERWVRRTELS